MANKYYAVKIGKEPGIYQSWADCSQQVTGFKGALYKSFNNLQDAKAYLNDEKKEVNNIDIIAYVDGSYNVKNKEYGYGCVLLFGGQEIKKLSGRGNDDRMIGMRNVAGEIMGCLKAIEYAINHGYRSIAIYFDYEGIEKWANHDWQANKPGTKAYQQVIDKFRQMIEISFIKVLAHSGDFYNEQADKLAKKAVGINEKKNQSK